MASHPRRRAGPHTLTVLHQQGVQATLPLLQLLELLVQLPMLLLVLLQVLLLVQQQA